MSNGTMEQLSKQKFRKRKSLVDEKLQEALKENLDEMCKMLPGLMNY